MERTAKGPFLRIGARLAKSPGLEKDKRLNREPVADRRQGQDKPIHQPAG